MKPQKPGNSKRRKPLTFSVYPYPGSLPQYYTVKLYDRWKELRRARGGGKENSTVIAFFDPADCELPHLGLIHLCRLDRFLTLTIVHEAFHATVHAQENLGFMIGKESTETPESYEELAARWQEALVSAISKGLSRRKVKAKS